MKEFVLCWRCRRRLNDPVSIKAGIGPTCAAKIKQQDHGPLFRNIEDSKNDVLTEEEKKEGVIL